MKVVETLQYFGPNRRGDFTCLEKHVVLDESERQAFAGAFPDLYQALDKRLAGLGVDAGFSGIPVDSNDGTLSRFAQTLCKLALALQQAGGHRVGASGHYLDNVSGGVWAWFEFEHDRLAAPAWNISLRLLADAVPGLAIERPEKDDIDSSGAPLEQAIGAFIDTAKPLVLPLDTEAIIASAKRLNIPVEKLERMPFMPPERDFRVRMNGLLRVGHGPHQLEVDGTLCTSRGEHLLPMIRKRRAQGGPVPASPGGGQVYHVLVAGGKTLGLVVEGQEIDIAGIHPETVRAAEQLAGQAGVGLLLLNIQTTDITRPLGQTGGVVIDLDLAPELEKLVSIESGLHQRACEAFLRWMFPVESPSRVPIIAVTGTNGKTTTCRMIMRIATVAGHHPGLSCTEGLYIGKEYLGGYADLGGAVFHAVLNRRDVDFAVFEEWFGRICRTGFAYVQSDVGVCTNVTRDHLGSIGTYTVEQMATVKEAVVERAREAAVLNADDPYCLAMAPRMNAKRVCLVSCTGSDAALQADENGNVCACVVEAHEDRPWIVMHDGDRRVPVIAVADIPATFDGRAVFNVDNAAHAVAASYLAGLPLDAIRRALAGFAMSIGDTPGRLNIFEDLPYRVIMDYAHNYDGYLKMLAFIDQVPCEGRRIMVVAFTGDRLEEDVIDGVGLLAGHFDHFVCRNYTQGRGQPLEQIPRWLRNGLLRAGIDDSAISVIEDAQQGINHALDMAQPGDLVVILAGTSEFEKIWENLEARSRAVQR